MGREVYEGSIVNCWSWITGLVLAIGLTKQGIPFRIIDKNQGLGETSRFIGIQARTLEFYANSFF